MRILRATYRVLRGILFTGIALLLCGYILLYVIISLPFVQKEIKSRAEKLASEYVGSKVTIGRLDIKPFNEVRLFDVHLDTPDGERCVDAEVIGAGVSLRKLIMDEQVRITYAEIVGLNAHLWKDTPESKLNIQFLIDAFAPKDKNKPPTQFDIDLRNVVIRKSSFTWDKRWIVSSGNPNKLDFNHISLSDVKADIALPKIANDDFEIDMRRIAAKEKSGLTLESLSFMAHVTSQGISLKNFKLILPNSNIALADIDFKYNGFNDIKDALSRESHEITLRNTVITPSDFAPLLPQLSQLQTPYTVSLDASGTPARIELSQFLLSDDRGNLKINLRGDVKNVADKNCIAINVDALDMSVSEASLMSILPLFLKNDALLKRLAVLGNVKVALSGSYDSSTKKADAVGKLNTGVGEIDLNLKGLLADVKNITATGKVKATAVNLGTILNNKQFGMTDFTLDADVKMHSGDINGVAYVVVPYFDFRGIRIDDIEANVTKDHKNLTADIEVDDELIDLDARAMASLAGANSTYSLTADISDFKASAFGLFPKWGTSFISGIIDANLAGNNIDNIVGEVNCEELHLSTSAKGDLYVDPLSASIVKNDAGVTTYKLNTDFCNAIAESSMPITEAVNVVKSLVAKSLPDIAPMKWKTTKVNSTDKTFNASIDLLANDDIYSFINSPVTPLMPVQINASYDGAKNELLTDISAPYLQQGKNKLIKYTALDLSLSGDKGLNGSISTNVAAKHDRVNVKSELTGVDNGVKLELAMEAEHNPASNGKINLYAAPLTSSLTGKKGVSVDILPSNFALGGEKWVVNPAHVEYLDKVVKIDNLKIWHANQYVEIGGSASDSPMDIVAVDLAGIDLQYIFDILNINYVNFGGIATGRVLASNAFSSRPILRTERLHVDNFQYNESIMGDAELESHWDADEKMVAINADIEEGEISTTKVRGGVYVTRDSLSFDFYTNNSNIKCLQPFMSGFTSKVDGRASGHLKMYGTFSDIDLNGRVYADTLSLLVDHTNVVYSCSDSVFFTSGRITIPQLKLYDKYGNHALFKGEVRHNYLHDATFDFEINDAKHLLVYDTDASSGDFWYGRIFADGGAKLSGVPGIVSLEGNLTSSYGSSFAFVLDEKATAADYSFITFTDKKKDAEVKDISKEEVIEQRFAKIIRKDDGEPTVFDMNLSLTVNPAAEITLVMDPKAGDKIVAKGNGGLRMQYSTESDEFNLYGKYVLDNGTYNFSLQDLILRNFKIREGSAISFNGDPMQGVLDISAAYRVNTNITDLDQSFVNDADLNRTNVPVDALLNVSGEISQPEIKFDIDMPTMTPEMERKVRSIISTEEMLNIQVIYLLALNRFYTPDYSNTGQGGELASVASSTISSQISNILGAITDKFTVAPSFKSDRSDFSDFEFDVALSSSLFNNRLLINGNLGYRDKTTSLTTFVGDFDIEYLLNRDGSLRLKAYNHFNDASYYLKSALTTQGLGVVFRKDFNNPFTLLRRKKRKK